MGFTRNGLVPKFVEPDQYYNLDPSKIAAAIGPKTKAICVVHLYGQIANMPEIMKIARKYNLITDFGKFMDPLADKLLVCSAMIALIEMNRIPSWVVIIIIAREFIISGFRLIASDNGVVIAASYWGKFKTTFQMVMICLMIANFPQLQILTNIIMWIALILTVVSLIDYLVKNKDVMKNTK